MHLSEITVLDDSYTPHFIRSVDLELASAFATASEAALQHLARLGESVVESILNHPAASDGCRHIARASYRETVRFEKDRVHWRLARSPVTVTSVEVCGELLDLDEVLVYGSTGVIRRREGYWYEGSSLVVEYEGGWRTHAQIEAGVSGAGPMIPDAIVRAGVRAAQLALSGYERDDVGVRSLREEQQDSGSLETVYAAPPTEAGADAEIFRLLAPWRRLVLA